MKKLFYKHHKVVLGSFRGNIGSAFLPYQEINMKWNKVRRWYVSFLSVFTVIDKL
uniref:Uncharacterized protein n=1 Tax=Arundo donax TaxID=35708 RepID=A0A0A9QCF8_ARUDO